MGGPKRYAAKTDRNQAQIVAELRQAGYTVAYIRYPVDLAVSGYQRSLDANVTLLVEVKADGGKLRKSQIEFIDKWRAPVLVARKAEDIINYFQMERE